MKNQPIFCTVFDKNYLYQGLAAYRSLEKTVSEFKLYTLALDEIAATTLEKLKLKSMIVVRLHELPQQEINENRPLLSYGQFCWSMQPLTCLYVLEKGEPNVTYIEADSLFFSSPQPLLDEIGEKSISLAPHWYSQRNKDLERQSGIYCTHFNFFKNNDVAKACLEFWKSQCFRYRATEPGFLIGQLCLNEWEDKFKDVAILKNRGAGVAPWNIETYELNEKSGAPTVNGVPVVFYHFHGLGKRSDGRYELGDYPLSREAIRLFYLPYILALRQSESEVAKVDDGFNFSKIIKSPPSLKQAVFSGKISEIKLALRPLKRKMNGTYNVYSFDGLKEFGRERS